MYDLYAILLHDGGAHAGHYIAYIKDWDSGKWLCFDDSSVAELDEEKFLKALATKTATGGGSTVDGVDLETYFSMAGKI